MESIATRSQADRDALFQQTAARTGLGAELVEKDFWVCWTLLQLFTMPCLQEKVIFKGGTSLSKCFGAIKRFSEDIDLIVDYQLLGYDPTTVARGDRSNSKWQALLTEIIERCSVWVEGELRQALVDRCRTKLGPTGWSISTRRVSGAAVLEFAYPSSPGASPSYLRRAILLEPGAHAANCPRDRYRVQPFAAEQFPQLFTLAQASVDAITIERTFWEKATILHAEFHRPSHLPTPPRYARHYYDVAMLSAGPHKATALPQQGLLAEVVAHKQAFYASRRAQYETAVPGTLKLVPPPTRLADLQADYEQMRVMIYGSPPKFDDILAALSALEAEINAMPPTPASESAHG